MRLDELTTLLDMLEDRAQVLPDRAAFTFEDRAVTFQQMWDGINRLGAHLLGKGIQPGDRAVLALPNGPEFFSAFYGVQRAGGIAVPFSPGASPSRIVAIARLCNAHMLIVPSDTPAGKLSEFQALGIPHGISLMSVAESRGDATAADFPTVSPDDIALIQYTSGSTGLPKGVCLSHGNLLTNVHQMIAGMGITEQEVFVSWLPVYHDMGLILKTIVPFYLAAPLHLLPTSLINIRRWLETIQKHRATFTAAPDFAYRLCLRTIDHPEHYELGSLRVALNAAEPVRPQTIARFEKAFNLGPIMVAGYGLAEATVGVSMWPPQTPPKVDERGMVSVGRPFPAIQIKIAVNDQVVGPGTVGEILVSSPANCSGYYDDRAETADLFWHGSFIRTGDLGYLDAAGDLFVVGRKKNIIKLGGETIFPQEVEQLVDAYADVRACAAVGVDKGGAEGEQVYVFAEVKGGLRTAPDRLYELAVDMVNELHDTLGFRPARLYFLKPHSIPMTHNGKVQHAYLKEAYLDGRLRAEGHILFPEV